MSPIPDARTQLKARSASSTSLQTTQPPLSPSSAQAVIKQRSPLLRHSSSIGDEVERVNEETIKFLKYRGLPFDSQDAQFKSLKELSTPFSDKCILPEHRSTLHRIKVEFADLEAKTIPRDIETQNEILSSRKFRIKFMTLKGKVRNFIQCQEDVEIFLNRINENLVSFDAMAKKIPKHTLEAKIYPLEQEINTMLDKAKKDDSLEMRENIIKKCAEINGTFHEILDNNNECNFPCNIL